MTRFSFAAVSILSLFATANQRSASAHDPLTNEAVQQYTADGSLEERKARVATLKQFRLAEGRRERAAYKVRRAALEASGMTSAQAAQALAGGPMMAFPFTSQPELRSTGTVRTLTLLVDFKDNRAADKLPGMTVDGIRENIYGLGTAVAQTSFKPHESLHEYYRRASQDQVDVQGSVFGWHQFSKNRAEYNPVKAPVTLSPEARQRQQAINDNRANFKILSEVMDALDATTDFAQFDNDNDGDIDLVTILYAGDPTGWGSFWWAYRWEFQIPEAATKKWDGKRAKQFVFQFLDRRGPNRTDFDPTTLLHEMGHAFGLADYYDYDDGVGPQGGVGGLDMMDANRGNQNAFSRWLLDWIKPTTVGSGPPAFRTLTASGSNLNANKAIAIFPGLGQTSAPGQEMFLVENRSRTGNDVNLFTDGLLIWHIDATVNDDGDDFSNDNSFTDRKLIRLVRADSASDFLANQSANAATYFAPGGSFTPTSTPNSQNYAGEDTGITIDQISAAGESMTIRIGFQTSPGPSPVAFAQPQFTRPTLTAAPGQPISVAGVANYAGPIDLDLLEALDRQLSAATVEDLRRDWQEIAATAPGAPPSETRVLVSKLLLSRWASKSGAEPSEIVAKLPKNDPLRAAALPLVLNSWAKNQPAEAARWFLDDSRTELRKNAKAIGKRFVHESFEGLYAADPAAAVAGLTKLSDTPQVFGAVDGILHAGAVGGESVDAVGAKLAQSGSEVVQARVDLVKAIKASEDKIKDPKKKREFKRLMQDR